MKKLVCLLVTLVMLLSILVFVIVPLSRVYHGRHNSSDYMLEVIIIEKDTSHIVGDRMDGLFCGAANFCIANLPKAANTNI